ncbi:phosphotransferase enzyme family protein [Cellulomonas carbonis]|uniref:phosphotransferase enzyme family protein n=1 Tax=Cellulomonas carbonis TaxID=1386092 RepID=UPI0013775F96|nr:phosphotransferase [Cellulomonas carbonis]
MTTPAPPEPSHPGPTPPEPSQPAPTTSGGGATRTQCPRDADLPHLVAAALARWGLRGADVVGVRRSYNTVVHVEVGHRHLALRVAPRVGVHAPGSDEAERTLLDHLAAAGAAVPRVHPTIDGAASTTVDGPHGRVTCMLLDWVPGSEVPRPATPGDAADLGRLSATLHDAAPTAPGPPSGVLDGRRVLTFHVPDRLGEAGDHAPLLLAARASAQRALDDLWSSAPEPPRLLHGDLTPANVVRSGDRLVPIDFQDALRGHPEQDVAITLVRLARDDAADGGERCAAFRAGYEAVRPWPLTPDVAPHLAAARSVQLANLGLVLRNPGLAEHLDLHARALRPYVERSGAAAADR